MISRRRAESIASFNNRPHPYKEEAEGLWQCLDHYDVSAPSDPLWPGSGAAFDAGGQWLDDKKRRVRTMAEGGGGHSWVL